MPRTAVARGLLIASTAGENRGVRIVDLSHHYEDGMPVFPGLPEPSFRPIARVEDDGYAMSEYHLLNP